MEEEDNIIVKWGAGRCGNVVQPAKQINKLYVGCKPLFLLKNSDKFVVSDFVSL